MAARWCWRMPTRSPRARMSGRGRWCACRCMAAKKQVQGPLRPSEGGMSDILIVDDERDIREVISDILGDEGFETRLAANSDEAMAAIRSDPPGLLILDIWLKDSQMDGIDILKTVKREHPDIPVIIISGHGNIEIAVAAIKQGAYDFIQKPFNIDQLLVVIRRGMETSRLRRENQALSAARARRRRCWAIRGPSVRCRRSSTRSRARTG